MHYSEKIWRPPGEANSVLLQVTVGCSHNKCKFCTNYNDVQFRVEPMEQIEEDLHEVKTFRPYTDRVFLLNGDAFVLSFEKLKEIVIKIREHLPYCKTISMYARVSNIKNKTVDQLTELQSLGINNLYIGLESGYDYALSLANKGVTTADILEQCKKLEESGIEYSIIYLSGLAGHGRSEKNALESAELFNQLKFTRLGALSLTLVPGSALYEASKKGEFIEATELERTIELKTLIENLKPRTSFDFDANHVSVSTPVKGNIPEDKEFLIKKLQYIIDNFNEEMHKRYRLEITAL